MRIKKTNHLKKIIMVVFIGVLLVHFKNIYANNEIRFYTARVPGGVEVIGYGGPQVANLIIPQKIDGKKVVQIGYGAFASNELTSVSIPDTVAKIGDYAFSNNKLTSVVLPNSVVEVGNYAFSNNQLESIETPNNDITWGMYVFSENKLTSYSFPDNMFVIPDGFLSNNQLNSITVPNQIVRIGNKAFESNNLDFVEIGINVNSIGEYAFYDNQLTTVIIPDSVVVIESSAFQSNNLKTIELGNGVVDINRTAFAFNELLSIKIPDNVKNIEFGAFWNNKISFVEIGSGVINIGEWAFLSNQVNTIIISEGIKFIGSRAFEQSKLKSLIIPESVISIGDYAFAFNKIHSLEIGNNVESIGDYAFYDNELENIVLPESLIAVNDYTFKKNKLTSLTIPNGLQRIGNYAFSDNYLQHVIIPASVDNIGDYAFYINSLKGVQLPNSALSIGDYAFAKNQLKSLLVPPSVKQIGEYSFAHNHLGMLKLGAERVEKGAFAENREPYLYSLFQVDIHPQVAYIDESAFVESVSIIRGARGSYAETYANNQGYDFISQYDSVSEIIIDSRDIASNRIIETSYYRGYPGETRTLIKPLFDDYELLIPQKTVDVEFNDINNRFEYLYYKKVKKISFVNEEHVLEVNEIKKLDFILDPLDSYYQEVIWSSSNTAVATVNNEGEVVAVGPGNAIIKIVSQDGNHNANAYISVIQPASGIILNKSELHMIVDETEILSATIVPIDSSNKNVMWSSSNDYIASVDNKGNVWAKNTGTAIITCMLEDGGYTASATIFITQPVTGITTNDNEITLNVGESYGIFAYIEPSDASNQKIHWSSSNPSVATVDNNGNVMAESRGIVTITATTEDGGYTASNKVTVIQPIASIDLNKRQLILSVGEFEILEAIILPHDATDKDVFWKSSDPSVATVDQKGKVVAKTPGTALISISKDTENGSFEVSAIVYVDTPTNLVSALNGKVFNGILTGLHIDNTIQDITNKIQVYADKDKVEAYNSANQLKASNKQLVTGDLLKVTLTFGAVEQYRIAIKGDINGDGKITAADYVALANHLLNKNRLSGTPLVAAYIREKNEFNVSAADYVALANHLLKKNLIHE